MALSVAALFVRPPARATFLTVLVILSVRDDTAWTVLRLLILPEMTDSVPWTTIGLGLAALLFIAWWIGAALKTIRSLEPERHRRLPRVAALAAALMAVVVASPHYPVFRGPDFELKTANAWEVIRAWRRDADETRPELPRVDAARVALRQAVLLDHAVAELRPQHPGVTDVYMVALAGSAAHDVFWRELDGAMGALAAALPADGGGVRLVNHGSKVDALPVASRQNFAAAVRAVGKIIDREEDVLVLLLTSHGSRSGVELWLPGFTDEVLTPAQVVSVLDQERIRNRIVIVSACYGGVFVDPLAGENTIILAAADKNSTSFGCADGREWSFFGEALFKHGMRPGTDLEAAFAQAKALVAEWEAREALSPSNPQAHFGPALMARLAPLHAAGRTKTSPSAGAGAD